ncbi:MAG: hypothetical protein ACRDTU_15055 [Micromonosporaceae bacterium]
MASRNLLTELDRLPGVRAASGLWTRRSLPLHQAWLDDLPPRTHGEITGEVDTDGKVTDGWAQQRESALTDALAGYAAPYGR